MQPSTLEDPYAYRFGPNDPFQRHGPSPSMLSSHPIAPPVDTGRDFIRSMTTWANRVLNATSHAAASSGFVATELPPLPRKRQRDACSGASQTALPRKAAQARLRNQRQLTNTDVPSVPLTESQVVQMVQTLESMPGPVSYRDTTLLPPVDEALAPSQQFLRDFHALHLPLPPSESMPTITLPSSMFSSDPQSSNTGEHGNEPLITRMNKDHNDRDRLRNAKSRANRILRAAKETDNSQRLADRDVDERFGTDTDAAFIRGMVMQSTQIPAQHSERTSSFQSQPFRSDVNMADSALLPAPYPPHGTQTSLIYDRHRVRHAAARAENIQAMHSSANQNLILPQVTGSSSLTMNAVAASVTLSIRPSERISSRNRLQRIERSTDALLQRQSRRIFEPGLAESPPDIPNVESIHFDSEAQSMPSYDQQQAAEQPFRAPDLPRVEH